MTVLMFHKRFVAPILAGTKTHTIRRDRKRPIPIGDALSLRHWEGQGYRSPQVEFFTCICDAVFPIAVAVDHVRIGDPSEEVNAHIIATASGLDVFAISDGFEDWADMMAYYREQKIKLPFRSAEMIEWRKQ